MQRPPGLFKGDNVVVYTQNVLSAEKKGQRNIIWKILSFGIPQTAVLGYCFQVVLLGGLGGGYALAKERVTVCDHRFQEPAMIFGIDFPANGGIFRGDCKERQTFVFKFRMEPCFIDPLLRSVCEIPILVVRPICYKFLINRILEEGKQFFGSRSHKIDGHILRGLFQVIGHGFTFIVIVILLIFVILFRESKRYDKKPSLFQNNLTKTCHVYKIFI